MVDVSAEATLVVRRLTSEDDLATFGQIVLDSYRVLPGHPPDPDYDAELLDVAGRVEHGTVFGAFVDARPAGCVSFVRGPGGFHAENLRDGESSFRMLGVDTALQRGGIGAALVRRCLDEATAIGAAAVFIYSGDWMHAAHRLYARLGFVRTPERDWVFEDPPVTLFGFRYAAVILAADDPLALAATSAVQDGDLDGLTRLLNDNPELASAVIGDPSAMSRSLLHAVTDWPGHFPNAVATVQLLVAAGADVNARFTGPHKETPLHWAASSDDVEVLDALLDAGADIEADGAVIAGGTPLMDAVAFGQWNAARRLVERGARVPLCEAAALGLTDRLHELCAADPAPDRELLTHALWYASHGGQLATAEYVFGLGADLNWISFWDHTTPLDAAQREGSDEVVAWARANGGKSAAERGAE